jgi:hypothetical protein
MKIEITIPLDQYNKLSDNSKQLSQISSLLQRFDSGVRTVYDLVYLLDSRERQLTESLKIAKEEIKKLKLENNI